MPQLLDMQYEVLRNIADQLYDHPQSILNFALACKHFSGPVLDALAIAKVDTTSDLLPYTLPELLVNHYCNDRPVLKPIGHLEFWGTRSTFAEWKSLRFEPDFANITDVSRVNAALQYYE